MSTLSKKKIAGFIRARYPDARFSRLSDTWIKPDGTGFSPKEARAMAEAEIDLFARGIATRPSWY